MAGIDVISNTTGQAIKDAIFRVAGAVGSSKGAVYGFHVNGAESDPAAMITYLQDAVGMTPAGMNYTTGAFDYGSWQDAFFMPRPCMLKSDGTVDYYLNPNNYALKEDGTASDIANTSYDGNAMMEWPKIYWKIVPDTDAKSGSVYIASYRVDSTYHCWSNINNQDKEVDHFYTAIYNGSNIDSKLRSISGQTVCKSQTGSAEITLAKANNATSNVLWYTETYADTLLINLLLMLIGKNMNTQAQFGNGHYTGGSEATLLTTGTMNDKGLFYGTNGTGVGVKVFGMENWWGNRWRRYAGHVFVSGVEKIKLTYGTADGSTATSYNTDGTGYLATGLTAHSGTNGGYISEMLFSEKGISPKTISGDASRYYCDGTWFNDSAATYAYRGGACNIGLKVGAFYLYAIYGVGFASWGIGAAVSCKPLA